MNIIKHLKIHLKKYAVVLFFAAFFLYGMAVVRDYGISWDEHTERNSTLITFGYVLPQAKEIVTDTVNYNALPALEDYEFRYYGVAGQMPPMIAEYLYQFRFNYQQVYLLRHLYTFAVFWFSCIFFYLICRHFTKSPLASLLGVFLLIASPRILADSFYNIKDLLFLSFFVITLYFGLLLIQKQSWPRLLAFGFFGGLCTNVRIVGAIPVICCVLTLGWKLLVLPAGGSPRQSLPRRLFAVAGSGLVCLLFYIGFTPVVWQNPVQGILGVIQTFSSFTTYTFPIFYMGEYPLSSQLPWHYLPVWILATTPIIHLALMGAGAVFQIGSIAGQVRRRQFSFRRFTDTGMEKLFLFLSGALPFLYVFLLRPVLYNGWRHFYFVWPLMALAALYGLLHLYRWAAARFNPRRALHGCSLLLAVGLLPVLLWIAWNHPFEYLYFNEAVRPVAEDCFEKDYWGVSQLDALEYICRHDQRETIKVWVMTPSTNRYFLSYEDQARIQIVEDLTSADYAIYNHTSTRSTEAISQMSLYSPLYVKEVDGMAVYTIYQRDYTPYFRSALEEQYDAQTGAPALVAAETGNIAWETEISGQTVTCTGQLSQAVTTDRLRLEAGNREDYDYQSGDLSLWISSDGKNWTETEILYEEDIRYDYDFYCTFPETQVAYVRLQHQGGGVQDNTWKMELQILARRDAQTDAHIDTVIQSATASHQAEEAPLAYDRYQDTRWTSGMLQEGGMYYEISLAQPITINQLRLVQAGYRSDFPGALTVLASADGKSWTELPYESDDMETFRFDPVTVRSLRFQIPQQAGLPETNWSIYEIQFFTVIQAEAAP